MESALKSFKVTRHYKNMLKDMMLPPMQGVNHHQVSAVILKYIKPNQQHYYKLE